MADLNALLEQLGNITMGEAALLTKMLEAKWGVEATRIVRQIVPNEQTLPGQFDVTPEQLEFDVRLTEIGLKKIEVIKTLRSLVAALGLKESKEAVENLPYIVRKGVSRAEADEVAARLTAAGAVVEVI